MSKKYKRILVANRGDSAVRVIRACKELGIETVCVYSTGDKNLLHTRLADIAVCVGDAKGKNSYLNAYNILAVASKFNVDAIHPGIGFFSENPDFASLCEKSGIDYIGTDSRIMEMMANKVNAKKVAKECAVPVIEECSNAISSIDECNDNIDKMGYPVILKAANGGGGKGIRVVYNKEELMNSFELCVKETENNFGNGIIMIEKYITPAKHIEVQVMADKYGNVIHLGDRECSIQRNRQKLIEEARCNTLSEELRNKLYKGAVDICKYIGFTGIGTIEFLVSENESYYFMEMNTRLQVEHTITEMITGIDIVKEQIMISQGEPLQLRQEDINFRGYAIQCRILSEYYKNGIYMPDYGVIKKFNMPGGFGVRIDAGYEVNNQVTTYYDSLQCKICCIGQDKPEAVSRMLRCLDEMQIEGINTNKELLINILKDSRFINGYYTTEFYEEFYKGV